MATYYCQNCDNFFDGDYHPCAQDPRDDMKIICEECAERLTEDTPQSRQNGVFTADQLSTIKKLEQEAEDDQREG